jgi:clan AA aspartic protease
MGHLHENVTISGRKAATVSMFVDTGATYSVIPKQLASDLGIAPSRARMVTLANGRRMKVGVSNADFTIGDRKAPATILVGNVPEPILGVETLEVLGLAVDPRRGRLIPTRSWTYRIPIFR